MATDHGTGAGDSVDTYLDALSSAAPTPGGGSAAALVGALAAALVAMVARLTAGRPSFATVDDDARRIIDVADAARDALTRAMAADEAAFQAVMAAYRLPRVGDGAREARREAIAEASRLATAPPLSTARVARRVLHLAREVAQIGNPSVTSDAAVAGWAAHAAIRASAVNVRANLVATGDDVFAAECETELAALIAEAQTLAELTEKTAQRSLM